MDTKNFFEKAIVSAELLANRTGVVATRAADAAGKTATSFVSATKLNMQIFDLNTEIEILYKLELRSFCFLECDTLIKEYILDSNIAFCVHGAF